MAISNDRSLIPLSYLNERLCDESELQKETSTDLDKSYFVIQEIFEKLVFQNITQWCKSLSPYDRYSYKDVLYRNPKGKIYTSIEFNSDYKIIDRDSYFKKGIPSSSLEINQFISTLLERFAKELKLIGRHKINVNFARMRYFEAATDMENFQLGWHFDSFAKSTLCAVFQNDFPYKEGKLAGLDIAENATKGPHALFPTRCFKPKGNYISCPYIENGAIIFHGNQGEIIHRRSILEKPLVSNAARTVIQIKLKDLDWLDK